MFSSIDPIQFPVQALSDTGVSAASPGVTVRAVIQSVVQSLAWLRSQIGGLTLRTLNVVRVDLMVLVMTLICECAYIP